MLNKLLLNADAGDGGSPNTDKAPSPAATPPASAAPPSAEPPPAAVVVATGKKTEREVELEKRLEQVEKDKKDRETQICELQDQNFALKAPPKKKKVRVTLFSMGD
jgi:hypothetical protein